jgi:serine/threonine protein kinase
MPVDDAASDEAAKSVPDGQPEPRRASVHPDSIVRAPQSEGMELHVASESVTFNALRSSTPADQVTLTPGGRPETGATALTSGRVFDGRYCLREQIGRGGMGEVWVADQVQGVRRRVAIKVIRHDFNSPQSIARFEVERQALAMLDHPHIAKVLDSGVEFLPSGTASWQSGTQEHAGFATAGFSRPYIVMEWIQGTSLTKFCDDAQMSVPERVRLLISVCHAIQHAHQKGIIHRDLKPTNILVTLKDGLPVAKVIDFGVAKLLTSGMVTDQPYTQVGMLIGTLEFMSPEQAEPNSLDIDTRSDIYSLGVVLYELLTGHRPFDLNGQPFTEIVRVIKTADPVRPSARIEMSADHGDICRNRASDPKRLRSQLRGELDWIVLRCLEKKREQRYDSAGDLAADLGRFLDGQPVSAHPPSWRYRVTKEFRRRRGLYISAALLLLTLTAGIMTTTRAMIVARKESQRAAGAELVALNQAEELTREHDRVLAAQVEAQRQADVSRAVRDFLQNDLLGQANVNTQVRSVVADPTRPGRFKPDPTIRQLLDQFSRRFAEGPVDERLTTDVRAELFEVIGNTYRGIGDFQQGEQFLRQALQLYEQEYSKADLRTLQCQVVLARAILQSGDAAGALSLLQDAASGLRRLRAENDPIVLDADSALAWALRSAGQPLAAIEVSESILQRLGDSPTTTLETLKSLDDLSWAYKDVDRVADALLISRRIVPQMQVLFGEDHPSTLIAMHHQAALLSMSGLTEEAITVNEAARRGRTAIFGPKHPETLWTMHTLAECYTAAGRHTEAVALAQETLAGRQEVLSSDHPHLLSSRFVLAQCLAAAQDPGSAISELQILVPQLEADDFKASFSLEALELLASLLEQRGESSVDVRNMIGMLKARATAK